MFPRRAFTLIRWPSCREARGPRGVAVLVCAAALLPAVLAAPSASAATRKPPHRPASTCQGRRTHERARLRTRPCAAKPARAATAASEDAVTLCHATGSATNPFVELTLPPAGVVNGHVGSSHQDGRDIIPPFGDFPGQNWDGQGQETLANGCVAPSSLAVPNGSVGVLGLVALLALALALAQAARRQKTTARRA